MSKDRCVTIMVISQKHILRELSLTLTLICMNLIFVFAYDTEQQFLRIKIKKNQHWHAEVKEKYRFIPLSDMLLPAKNSPTNNFITTFDAHRSVAESREFNFMAAQIQLALHLNPNVWDHHL